MPPKHAPATPSAEPASTRFRLAKQPLRDRKRRRREMLFASLAFILVLVLTTVQLDQFRSGDALFVVMFNVNFVLLFGILLVVLRNAFKLLLERRRRVLGSHLRTKLVLAFVCFALLPCSLMFLVTTKYVQLSMDFWFKDQVETSMDTTLDLVSSLYNNVGSALINQARHIDAEAAKRSLDPQNAAMNTLLAQKQQEYGNALVGLYQRNGSQKIWHAREGVNSAWEKALNEFNWEQINNQGYSYVLVSSHMSDYIVAVFARGGGQPDYLTLAFDMGEDFQAKVDRVIKGSREYRNLRNIKKPLKLLLYSSLGVLTALIILGAVWFGFRLAREMSAPIFALAAGTNRIAQGDLSVRLSDNSRDEFGMLIRSFNHMAQDLEQSRHETNSAYSLLAEQNQKIARHSEYIETVLNNIAAGVASFDSNGCIATVNRAACEILDLKPEDLIGKRIEDFMPSVYGTTSGPTGERFHRRQESRSQHNVSLSIGGEERRLLVHVVDFSTEEVYSGAVAVFEDVSELERMQRMAAWREVARRIAHEIKNPLTPIKLCAQRLTRKFAKEVNDPAFTQSTELIVRQVEHLQSMVEEFSAFAKLPEVHPRPGTIIPLLNTVIELFRNSHSGITWELCLEEDLPLLPMDREALNRAFINIFSNAAEALIAAGTPNPKVTVTATWRDTCNHLRINITDNGPGLREEERSRLFEPYFSRKKGGTGLGLAIVRSIIADHKGYVRASSHEGGGTSIIMELPFA